MLDRARTGLVALLALAVAAAIGSIASVAIRLRTVERAEREARGDPVLQLDPDRATALRIRTDGGDLSLARRPGGWRIVSPVEAPADQDAVASLLGELSSLVRRATAAPPGEPKRRLRPYGLDEPRTVIEVTLQGGRVERLALGADTGADGVLFVMPTGGEVAVVASSVRADLEKGLSDLRARPPPHEG